MSPELSVLPLGAPYPIRVEGSEHGLYVLGGLLVVRDLEEALELVHEERAAGALLQELLVPLLKLRRVRRTDCAVLLRLLPADCCPILAPGRQGAEPVPPAETLPTDSLGEGPLPTFPLLCQPLDHLLANRTGRAAEGVGCEEAGPGQLSALRLEDSFQV